MAESSLLRAFRFQVHLRLAPQVVSGLQTPVGPPVPPAANDPARLGDGGFQECTGLEVEMDVQEYLEGGRNDGVIRRAGRGKYQNVVLKRGMFYGSGRANGDLWRWLQSMVAGERPIRRYNGVIEVMSVADDVVATWTFDRGLPAKIRGPELNAKTGEIAIEELTIAHEGLRLWGA
jgi:phage tail-like protein